MAQALLECGKCGRSGNSLYSTGTAVYFSAMCRIGFGGTTWSSEKAMKSIGARSAFSKFTDIAA